MTTKHAARTNADISGTSAEPSDAEIEAAALEFDRHEQFLYGDDDQPRCECGFRLEEAPNGTPVPSLRMHQARAALVAAWKAARIARGEGDAHRPERCPTCGCELAYPTAVHVVDCGEGSE